MADLFPLVLPPIALRFGADAFPGGIDDGHALRPVDLILAANAPRNAQHLLRILQDTKQTLADISSGKPERSIDRRVSNQIQCRLKRGLSRSRTRL